MTVAQLMLFVIWLSIVIYTVLREEVKDIGTEMFIKYILSMLCFCWGSYYLYLVIKLVSTLNCSFLNTRLW